VITLAIVGSRDFRERGVIRRSIARWIERAAAQGDTLRVVSGGARGADTIGQTEATGLGVDVIVHPALWDLHGKAAGFIRNEDIVRDATVVLAFFAPGAKSRGTSHTVGLAKKAGKPVYAYHEGAWECHETLDLPQ